MIDDDDDDNDDYDDDDDDRSPPLEGKCLDVPNVCSLPTTSTCRHTLCEERKWSRMQIISNDRSS